MLPSVEFTFDVNKPASMGVFSGGWNLQYFVIFTALVSTLSRLGQGNDEDDFTVHGGW